MVNVNNTDNYGRVVKQNDGGNASGERVCRQNVAAPILFVFFINSLQVELQS